MLAGSPYRDSVDPISGECLYDTRSAGNYRTLVEKSGIPIYHLAGWYDMFPRDTLLWWRNLDNPQKVVIGPWFHVDRHGLDDEAEHLRWYDHWLKGIDNGVMDEDPIHYWTLDAPEGEEWRSTSTWPLPNEQRVDFYLGAGPSGTAASVNDGVLSREPAGASAHDDYVADVHGDDEPRQPLGLCQRRAHRLPRPERKRRHGAHLHDGALGRGRRR